MKAIVLQNFGSAEELVYLDIPKPRLKPDEVLIRSHAIGLNPVDVKTRKGKGQAAKLRDDPPMILGWDVSGTVEETGSGVIDFKKGDEVFGMINLPGHGRAYAEYVAAPAAHLAIKPASVTHEEAAAACLAAMTAWQALHEQIRLQTGDRILIHAASGGVGHYAVQFAKLAGAYVIGTSSAANREMVLATGADEHIDYTTQHIEDIHPQVDFVLDAIGGENIDRSLKALKPGGTIISLPSGVSETVGEQAAMQGKKGIFFFVRSEGKHMQQIAILLAQNKLRSHVSRVFQFNEIRAAHDLIETGKVVGKLVISMNT